MNVALEMLKAASKAGYTEFALWADGEEVMTTSLVSLAWAGVNQVDVCEIHMHGETVGHEWVLIIPENGNEENLSDFYAEGWVNDWYKDNVR